MNKQDYLEQLCDVMGQLRKLLEGHESHEERAATLMQFSALNFLQRHHAATVGALAVHLKLSKSSATQLVERLVKAELVERKDDPEDGRIVRLHLSLRGEHQIAFMKKRYIDKISAIFTKVPDKDLRELIRIHTELIKTLQKEKQDAWNK
jgi:DNA-binding MarR family transcriptional regulator